VSGSLQKIHAVQAERFDFNNSFALGRSGLRNVIDVERSGRARAVFDVWAFLVDSWQVCGEEGKIPTARIVEAIFAEFSQLRRREEKRREED
jgi:hypothetical protein